jgi:hypothetical protein
MALNSSGPISLAGTTTGQSIEIELAGNGTTQISLNDTAVRTLAGVASGQITMPTNFWGKSSNAVSFFMQMVNYNTEYCCNCCTCVLTTGGYTNSVEVFGSYVVYTNAYAIGNNNYGYQYAYSLKGSTSNTNGIGIWDSNYFFSNFMVVISSNIYMTGSTANDRNSILIAKFDSSFNVIEKLKYKESTNTTYGTGITSDSSNNRYILGQVNSTGLNAGLLIKTNSSGVVQWSRKTTTTYNAAFIATDTAGNTYISSGINIIKFDTSGNISWQKNITNFNIGSMTIDSSGNLIVGGQKSVPSYNGTVIKISSGGTILWQRQIAFSANTYVSVDSSDNIYVNFFSNIINIVKYNSSGVIQLTRQAYFNISPSYTGLIKINSGNMYIPVGWSNAQGTILSLPTDGSKTGNYNNTFNTLTYSSATITDSAASISLTTSTLAVTSPTIIATTSTDTLYPYGNNGTVTLIL